MHRPTGYFTGSSKLFIFGCAICLLASGYVAGRLSGHDHEAGPAPIPPAAPAPATARAAAITENNRPAPAPARVAAPAGWDEQKWLSLHNVPATDARNASLADLLEKLAAVDPQKALGLAQAEGNLRLRKTLIQSVLHGWGRLAPLDASNYALALPGGVDREEALRSVFDGAVVTDPDAAMQLAGAILQQNPGEAASYGNSMIDALCASGNFALAAQMAGNGNDGQTSIWMAEAYSKWAALQPEAAAQAANDLADPAAKNQALHGVIGGWAEADPAGLTAFLAMQPSGGDRGQMLGQALESWTRLDPVASAQWINANSAQLGTDLDAGIKAVATVNAVDPPTAVEWAGTINDGTLRSEALTDVLRNWVQTDFASAKKYFDATPDLRPADRQQISEIIASMNSP